MYIPRFKLMVLFLPPLKLQQESVRVTLAPSALLYVLVSETVVNFIRQDPHVHGVKLHGQEYKVNCYQDDTNFTMRDVKSVDRVLLIYRCFVGEEYFF